MYQDSERKSTLPRTREKNQDYIHLSPHNIHQQNIPYSVKLAGFHLSTLMLQSLQRKQHQQITVITHSLLCNSRVTEICICQRFR
ncbi:hypothetical protein Hanom_Chr17g01537391 [Helianthus anomalus]